MSFFNEIDKQIMLERIKLNQMTMEELIQWYSDVVKPDADPPEFIYDFSREFPGFNCYQVHEALILNDVLPCVGVTEDNEMGCCYYYFSCQEIADDFVERLACFMIKRRELAKKLLLNVNCA